MLLTVGNLTLYILPKIFKFFFQLIDEYFEKVFLISNLCSFFYFSSNIIVFYIILKLRQPRTQNFLKYRNILSGSRDIGKIF